MTRDGKVTLYVNGFPQGTSARDLAAQFEEFGDLLRCDIPAPRNPNTKPFAFIEYYDSRDASEAYDKMHGEIFGGERLSVEWARQAPAKSWRGDRGPRDRARSPRRGYRDAYRRRSPRGRSFSRSPPPQRRRRSPGDSRKRLPSNSRSPRDRSVSPKRERSRSPRRDRGRSPPARSGSRTPLRDRSPRGRSLSRSRSPPPLKRSPRERPRSMSRTPPRA